MRASHGAQPTANCERNLAGIEAFLAAADAPQAFDALLDELPGTILPNLERIPGIGRPLPERPVRSVEVAKAVARLTQQFGASAGDGVLRDCVMAEHLLLCARIEGAVILPSIRHQRRLSLDSQGP